MGDFFSLPCLVYASGRLWWDGGYALTHLSDAIRSLLMAQDYVLTHEITMARYMRPVSCLFEQIWILLFAVAY